jgi:polar amino acid transport system substrate-binding protein
LRDIYRKWGLWNEDQVDLLEGESKEETFRISYSLGDILVLLVQGAAMTVFLTFASMLVAVLIGLPLSLCRLYGPAWVRLLAITYVEFFRGIPILLLLYFVYFGLPGLAQEFHLPVSLQTPAMVAAILGFGLNYAAYEAEIYRAGISSIPRGQWEAALSLGMSPALVFRRVILPQTIRVILPPSTNDLVALFKDTSVVSVIAVVELTKQYQIRRRNGASFLQVGAATAALYLIMSVPLGYLSRYSNRSGGHEHG